MEYLCHLLLGPVLKAFSICPQPATLGKRRQERLFYDVCLLYVPGERRKKVFLYDDRLAVEQRATVRASVAAAEVSRVKAQGPTLPIPPSCR